MENDIVVSKALLSSARVGAVVTVRTEEGKEYRARVMKVDGQSALVRAFEELCFPAESRLRITLMQALAKKEKMALVIQKATELGVSRIIPCISAKSTVPGGPGKSQDKSHRWPAVAQKAVEQCRRRLIPEITATMPLHEAVERFSTDGGLKLLLYEKENEMRLKDVLTAVTAGNAGGKVVLACGPEGGFTEEEVLFVRSKDFVPVRLGGRILRCETAALAALSIIQYELGDL